MSMLNSDLKDAVKGAKTSDLPFWKKDLSRDTAYTLLLLGGLALVLVAVLLAYALPAWQDRKQAEADVETARQQLASIKETYVIDHYSQEQVLVLTERVPFAVRESEIMNYFMLQARQAGVTVQHVQLSSENEGQLEASSPQTLYLDMKITGILDDLLACIAAVENDERLYAVQQISFSPASDTEALPGASSIVGSQVSYNKRPMMMSIRVAVYTAPIFTELVLAEE